MNKGWGWFLAVTCAALTGCNQWQPGSGYSFAVFSETGESVAAVFQTFEEKNNVTHTARKNFSSQVVLADDNGVLIPITELLEGNVADFYYQEEAEFLILTRRGELTEDDNGNDIGWIKVDRIGLNGQVTSMGSATGIIMLSCDGGTSKTATNLLRRVVPNPEGTILASIESSTTCDSRVQTLTFLDAQTLEPLQAPIALDDGSRTTRPSLHSLTGLPRKWHGWKMGRSRSVRGSIVRAPTSSRLKFTKLEALV